MYTHEPKSNPKHTLPSLAPLSPVPNWRGLHKSASSYAKVDKMWFHFDKSSFHLGEPSWNLGSSFRIFVEPWLTFNTWKHDRGSPSLWTNPCVDWSSLAWIGRKVLSQSNLYHHVRISNQVDKPWLLQTTIGNFTVKSAWRL